jgi:PKHD-type hydroxylase
MIIKNQYYCFKGALSSDICDKILHLGKETLKYNKENGIETKAKTMGNREKKDVENQIPQSDKTLEEIKNNLNENVYIRDSEIAWLTNDWLYDLIIPFVKEANITAGWKYEISTSEAFQFTKYENTGFYGWHNDGGTDHFAKYKRLIPGIHKIDDTCNFFGYSFSKNMIGKVRKISVTINLNSGDEYEGGNLKFDFGPHSEERFYEVKEARLQGSITVFPSYQYHCVTPVTKGTRYSLVLWSLGDPFK